MNKKQNVDSKIIKRSTRLKNFNKSLSLNTYNGSSITTVSTIDGKMLHEIRGDVSNGTCPLGGNEVECWMKYRKDYNVEGSCKNSFTASNYISDDGFGWYKSAKITACGERGGRIGITDFDFGQCYLPCDSGYDTHDFTCTGWKSECVDNKRHLNASFTFLKKIRLDPKLWRN